jgi:hypothetical protein
MRFLRASLLIAAVAVVALGCTTFKASGLAYVPADQKFAVVGDFRAEVWVNEFLGSAGGSNIFNITADATEGPVKNAIEAAIKAKGGTGAVNITIVHQASFLNLILNGITGSIWAPSMVIITGIVVK